MKKHILRTNALKNNLELFITSVELLKKINKDGVDIESILPEVATLGTVDLTEVKKAMTGKFTKPMAPKILESLLKVSIGEVMSDLGNSMALIKDKVSIDLENMLGILDVRIADIKSKDELLPTLKNLMLSEDEELKSKFKESMKNGIRDSINTSDLGLAISKMKDILTSELDKDGLVNVYNNLTMLESVDKIDKDSIENFTNLDRMDYDKIISSIDNEKVLLAPIYVGDKLTIETNDVSLPATINHDSAITVVSNSIKNMELIKRTLEDILKGFSRSSKNKAFTFLSSELDKAIDTKSNLDTIEQLICLNILDSYNTFTNIYNLVLEYKIFIAMSSIVNETVLSSIVENKEV